MEASTLFIVSSIHRKRAGAAAVMMAKDAHLPKDSDEMALFKGDRAIRVAIEGIKRLIEHDRREAKRRVPEYGRAGEGVRKPFPIDGHEGEDPLSAPAHKKTRRG